MIIESGHDVRLVLASAVRQADIEGICIIAMDEDLRLLSVCEVVPRSTDTNVLDHVEDIADALDNTQERPRYFALAWTSVEPRGPDTRWLEEIDARLDSDPALSHVRLLGLIVLDPKGMSSTVPQYDFSFYPELAGLPRAVAIAGPHGDGCSCTACYRDRRRLGGDDYWNTDEPEYYPEDDDDARRYAVAAGWAAPRHRPSSPVLDRVSSTDVPQYDPQWKRWFPDPERAYKRWTDTEESALLSAHFEGLSVFDISMMLQRQPGAIASRLNKLGVSSRPFVAGEAAQTVQQEIDGPDGRA